MLKCIDVQSSDNPVLFIDANVECYEFWQVIIVIFVLVYVVPFFRLVFYVIWFYKREGLAQNDDRTERYQNFFLCLLRIVLLLTKLWLYNSVFTNNWFL